MKILVTGFNPFNGEEINPAQEILNLLPEEIDGHEIHKLYLDVEYRNDATKVKEAMEEIKPDVCLLLGQAGGRKNVCFEYMALNIDSATIPDNKGELITHQEIVKNGALAYKSTCNIENLITKMNGQNLAISYSAGTFICNEVYYSTLKYIKDHKLNTKCGFIHFPFLPVQVAHKKAKFFCMNLNEMYDIFTNILKTIVNE